ncbi:tomoregulin-2a [Gadus morhua]|uniref:tomoregulin-2a n=1 Tax=Gadus morhua TaxID=8049 RepID=UPI0011B7929C|nr:tomoregulin-2-like [Gadus morhua]
MAGAKWHHLEATVIPPQETAASQGCSAGVSPVMLLCLPSGSGAQKGALFAASLGPRVISMIHEQSPVHPPIPPPPSPFPLASPIIPAGSAREWPRFPDLRNLSVKLNNPIHPCVCNIDCSHTNFNPVCASDGRSYDNPCQVKEASCQKQEHIEVKHLGHCQVISPGSKAGDGHYARTDSTVDKTDPRNDLARGLYIPCPDHFKNYCVHGECQYPSIQAQPSCSCHSGFSGPQCDSKEYNVMYVVPGSGKLRYVLIASIIGALQVAIICVVVLCITRKCPRTNRINRQKQNNVHYSTENTMRASTRLI